ncbi:hypothetical protein D915_000779 [Fasciola hepatica]|uniref:Uncharacterized protein n=1 Tax=Fasciola hepatica TaxID=6192 RepID=A0A4E0RI56_FASHE|nr:hypothetical protein D915_000779 [Fasciola hepatica]
MANKGTTRTGNVNMPAAALSCCDYMRQKPPPLFYMKQFDRITKQQLALVEHYRIAQAEHCKLGKSSMATMLETNKAYGAGLGSLEPESWQTGLEDCGDFYTHRWKELIRLRLGHNDHDRSSVREYNTRFTLPMELKDLEGLTPMTYCLKYCVLSNNRVALYQRTFARMRENRRPKINLKALSDALSTLVGGTLLPEQAEELFTLFELTPENRSLTPDEFSIVCAMTERLFYQKNLRSLSEETQQMQRGLLERADFHQIQIRLNGVKLNPALRRLLERIAETGTRGFSYRLSSDRRKNTGLIRPQYDSIGACIRRSRIV